VKPRRTHNSNGIFHLEDGTEDNDLWVEKGIDEDGYPVICSVWVPTENERAAILAGDNIKLVVWGTGTPPVALYLTGEPIGKPPEGTQLGPTEEVT